MTASSSTRRCVGSAGGTVGSTWMPATYASTARAAVVAVAPNLAATIRFEPALPAWRMRLQQASSQGSVTKYLAVYDHPFWREDGLSGEGFAPYGLVRELYDNTPPSASVGVLCTFLPGEQADAVAA